MQEVSPKERSWAKGVPHSVTINGQLFNLFQNQKMCGVPSEASRLQPPPTPPGGGVGRGSEFGCQPGTINTTQAGQPPRRVWPRYPGPGQLRNLLRCAGAKPSGWDALHLPGTLLGPESLHPAPA